MTFPRTNPSATSSLIGYLLIATNALTANVSAGCKNSPGSAGWPALDQWDTLNTTIQGRLIKNVPPGGVCRPEQANYDPDNCNSTAAAWLTENFHAQNPFSFNYNDDRCYPNIRAPCSTDGYPVYAVDARTASDVQAAFKFAQKYNIRVLVKATGHDFNFR